MRDYHRLQTLCGDVARHLEAAADRERAGRTTFIEMKAAEESAIDLFRGIVRAMSESRHKELA